MVKWSKCYLTQLNLVHLKKGGNSKRQINIASIIPHYVFYTDFFIFRKNAGITQIKMDKFSLQNIKEKRQNKKQQYNIPQHKLP